MNRRDIIVIGASAGGVQALKKVVQRLPRRFPASIFVVVHTSPNGSGTLDRVLNRADGNKAQYATDGMQMEPNAIYIAPPDRHMMLEGGKIRITMGPKTNRSRPSVDVLFRSAAANFGERVIGVVLTGYLDDGSAGLAKIKECGGVAVVQDPEDAEVSGMPEQALLRTDPDYCLPLDEIPTVLTRLVRESELGRGTMPKKVKSTRNGASRTHRIDHQRDLTGLTCPDCYGAIWEVKEGEAVQFECRVGHTYSPQSMMEAHSDSVERALWAALKSLEENIALTKKLVKYSRSRGRGKAAEVYEERIREKEKHALVLHGLLDGKSSDMLDGLDVSERIEADRKLKAEEAA